MDRFVTIEAFTNPIEAHIAKGLLESEGIPASLESEHHVWAAWHLSQALGGVRLQVPAECASLAREVLARQRRGEYQEALESEQELDRPRCARCGSPNLTASRSVPSLVGLSLSLGLLGLIFPPRVNDLKCEGCGTLQGRAL